MALLHKIAQLEQELQGLALQRDVPMHTLTTFRVGGPADLLLHAASEAELIRACNACAHLEVPYYILGNGSNLLVREEGVRGLVICLSGAFCSLTWEGNHRVRVGAGYSLTALAREALSRGFMGLEWACGIPGTVGGACAMNAGAYGTELKQVLSCIRYLENGSVYEQAPAPSDMGYRTSVYRAPARIALFATLQLAPDDGGAAARQADYLSRRQEKQPLKAHSAGSTFKRPPGQFAGALIEGAGLKGYSIGGAAVSTLHAGFVINTGSATANDILQLIAHIQRVVWDQYNVRLECEIQVW